MNPGWYFVYINGYNTINMILVVVEMMQVRSFVCTRVYYVISHKLIKIVG